ncbi:hypothetical protein [Changchengzhania lutea]|uniref:hypothetical protein n=1 Tax=Changchengzhania lutea TaxID=2049305 RepID=UPI00115D3018|nr:hypothetical protein [Changchengzhania lutea]
MKHTARMLLVCFFCSGSLISQVGVGTTTPTAELEIETTNTGIPALELNPQSAPVGTVDGQLSVIGDKLYLYDNTRGKWLSVETFNLLYGRTGSRTSEVLRFMGNFANQNSGALIPMNATIVHISARARNGDSTKQFSLEIRNGGSVVSSTTYNLSAREYIDTTLNIDVNSGDYLIARIGSVGTNITDLTLTVWLKWRQ